MTTVEACRGRHSLWIYNHIILSSSSNGAQRNEAAVGARVNCRHHHNITEACRGCHRYFRQNCWLSCHAYLIALFNTVLTVVSSKIWSFFHRRWLKRPLFSPSNGQIIIATRRGKVCRAISSLPAWCPRQYASNGRNIVDFGLSQHRHFFSVVWREASNRSL
jgi:hypothetical protein